MEVGATNPEYLGVGLGEDAAVLFEGDVMRAFGPGHVIIVDSSHITGSNVFELSDGEAVTVHNIIMHALVDGYGFNLTERRVLGPEELRARRSGALDCEFLNTALCVGRITIAATKPSTCGSLSMNWKSGPATRFRG